MTYDYVKRAYGVNPVVGERVRHHITSREGIVARERSPNHYVHVLFDGSKHALPCHPTEMDYLGVTPDPLNGGES